MISPTGDSTPSVDPMFWSLPTEPSDPGSAFPFLAIV